MGDELAELADAGDEIEVDAVDDGDALRGAALVEDEEEELQQFVSELQEELAPDGVVDRGGMSMTETAAAVRISAPIPGSKTDEVDREDGVEQV